VSSARPKGDPGTRTRILGTAVRLVARSGAAGVTLGELAKAAGVSRQALYLHFADRADLFLALVRHVDEQRGIPQAVQRVKDAPTAGEAIREFIAMQARMNPSVWPLARLLDGLRRTDAAVERSWRDRLDSRLAGCRSIVSRLVGEGALRKGLPPDVAADLLWALTSLRMWEDLVVVREWSRAQYEERLRALVTSVLVDRKDA
jgi:AcrR family transcriptional regulator